jgi:ribulose-bisphosphate carboxylase large chain
MPRPRKAAISCDWKSPGKKAKKVTRTRLMRHRGDFSWTGVGTEKYKLDDGTWAGVLRRTLTGAHGEETKFQLRYFEVEPGGLTTLERHRHEHVVICVRGKGRCRVRKRYYTVRFLDVLYIPPDAPHQLANPFDEPFGFLCIVDARRDRPRPIKG